jgi:outer membrane receptor for ferrienterochelin and colicin
MTYLDNNSGQVEFDPDSPKEDQSYWGSNMLTKRMEGWAKIGKVFPDKPFTSIGFQVSGTAHTQEAFFGLRDYNANHYSTYANLIYQSILGNTNHQFRTGASFQFDQFNETVVNTEYERMETVPGMFYEYTFNHLDIFTAVAGIRGDYHNIYGAFITPRMHLRYAPLEKTVFRASAGRGQKTASIFAENIGLFASSRQIFIDNQENEKPYGLDAEIAWNMGLNFSQGLMILGREAILNLDYYHTRFTNQIVVDYDKDPGEIHFYNLTGQSYSNSLQAQADLEPITRFDVRVAYRFNDVYATYSDELLAKPFTSRHRAFINLAYATFKEWKFDFTWSWQGTKRIPGTLSNPEEYQRPDSSPGFYVVNMQVSKKWPNSLEIYVGAENLLDYKQEDPIIASDDPFGEFFDASMIWGPVFGRKLYVGLRFEI